MIVVGIALISAGVVASRKKARLADRMATPPSAEGGSGPTEPLYGHIRLNKDSNSGRVSGSDGAS